MLPQALLNGPDNLDRNNGSPLSGLTQCQNSVEAEFQRLAKIDFDTTSQTVDLTLPPFPGAYIRGFANNVPLIFTIDSGATNTVLSKQIFDRIENKPKLTCPTGKNLTTADGSALTTYGVAKLSLKLGPLEIEPVVYVADTTDQCLLGADLLMFSELGPSDMKFSKKIIVLGGQEIPCELVGEFKTRKVTAFDTYVIPPFSEAIVDGFIERLESDDKDERLANILLEPHPLLSEKYSLGMAASISNAKSNITVKVRLINLDSTPTTIYQDTVIALAEACDPPVVTLFDQECPDEASNNDMIRRIGMCQHESSNSVHDSSYTDVPIPSHLTELYNHSIQDKDVPEQIAIKKLLIEYQDIFSQDEYDIGFTSLVEHAIDTGDARPIKQAPRKVPLAFRNDEAKAILQLLSQGLVRPSTSPWASPIVLVRKKSGETRTCVDYRKVNEVTVKDAYPLPRTQDCFDAVAGASHFSTLDFTCAYHQVGIKSEDIPKTAFCSKYGLFEWLKMPFGLTNSPATFQRLMEIVLKGLQWSTCLVYLDDVIIFGSTFNQALSRLRSVFDRIKMAGFKLKAPKCELLAEEVSFLGHILSKEGIKPNEANIEKIVNWAVPKNLKDVRNILGLGSYYRRFVKDYSKHMHPLIQLTKKDEPFNWTPECQSAFDFLKTKLTGPDIMVAHPTDTGHFILDTDACDVSLGAVLSQVNEDGQEKVVSYGSTTLGKSEKNYCITQKELLSVKYFILYYRQYLLGRHFTVRTDHSALKFLFSFKEPNGRIARWLRDLAPFDFSIEYRPGKKHGNADAVSRCPNPKDCDCEEPINLPCGFCKKCQRQCELMQGPLEERDCIDRTVEVLSLTENLDDLGTSNMHFNHVNTNFEHKICPVQTRSQTRQKGSQSLTPDLQQSNQPKQSKPKQTKPKETDTMVDEIGSKWGLTYSKHHLKKLQSKDPDIHPVMAWKLDGKRPRSENVAHLSPATIHYWNIFESLELIEGVLYRNFNKRDGSDKYIQLIVPKSLRSTVFDLVHTAPIGGHLGIRKTKSKLLQLFYWYDVDTDITVWVKKCDNCGSIKPPTTTPRAPLGKLSTSEPLFLVSTDVLGPFPVTKNGNKYILVVSDHFSKWVEIFAVPDQTAETTAKVILNEFICRFGCPLQLHSDQGRNYESAIFTELCRLLEIRKSRTTPRNPKSNGLTERFNRTLLKMIKAYLKGQQNRWDENLGCLAAAYRATPQESTSMTPNMLMLGREVRLPAEVIFGNPHPNNGEVASYGNYVSFLREKMQHAHEIAREHLNAAAERQKAIYDSKISVNSYKPGDYVWYLNENRKVGISPKLQVKYFGPCLVIMKVNDLDYVIQINDKGKRKLVHHNKLKPYEGDQSLGWAKKALKSKKLPVEFYESESSTEDSSSLTSDHE